MTNFLCKIFGWFCVATPAPTHEPVVNPPSEVHSPIDTIYLAPQSLFPNREWPEHIYALTENMPKVRDEFQLCPKGLTRRNWVHFFAAMAKHESNFKPALTYKENFKNSRGEYVISTGLFQVSYESSRGYGFKGITTEQLKDPYKNIEVAVKIVKTLAGRDGTLQGKQGMVYLGASKYWSVLRSGKAQATLKTLCE
jgi:hypothetical protein